MLSSTELKHVLTLDRKRSSKARNERYFARNVFWLIIHVCMCRLAFNIVAAFASGASCCDLDTSKCIRPQTPSVHTPALCLAAKLRH